MKCCFYTLLLSLTVPVITYGQEAYIPFIGQNKYWIYSQNDGWEPVPRSVGAFIISFASDTIINQHRYTKLMKYGLIGQHPCSGKPCFVPNIPYQIDIRQSKALAYIREDTINKKVYCLPNNNDYFERFCDTTEHLIYDFSQKVGDTLIMCSQLTNGGGYSRFFTIDTLKFEQLYGKMREVRYFEGYSTGGGLPYLKTLRLIEGVGLVDHIGFYIDDTAIFEHYCEGTLGDCNIVSGTNDDRGFSKHYFKLFPNPASENVNLQSDKDIIKIEFLDQSGRIVLSSYQTTVDINMLNSGLYFVKLTTASKMQHFLKFLKL